MRMRKLGRGQSVVFCVPKEIEFKILALKKDNSEISVRDVLSWAVSETWTQTQRQVPLWAVQGRRFERQLETWPSKGEHLYTQMTTAQAKAYLEPESQTLQARYRPGHKDDRGSEPVSGENENLNLISERCHEFGNVGLASATLEEEQERELAPEIEREFQVQRPPAAIPARHKIHPHVYSFVSTGNLPRPSDAFMPAFQALKNTSAVLCLDVSQFPSELLVTKDFATTIKRRPGSSFTTDSFQRPVGWILTSVHPDQDVVAEMVIISPFEANMLLPDVRKSTAVSLHTYAPRLNQGFSSLDKLNLYTTAGHDVETIPDNLRMQLNLFAGQLYLDSFSDYQLVCDILGVASVETPNGMTVAADGFIVHGEQDFKTTFTQSPLMFLRVLLSQIRKDCHNIDKTHMGKILEGGLLSPADFPSSADSDGKL